ncbi:hypothetical protein ABIF64_003078 [Bradyrhizobium japonicum]|uniref:hypothetical protein n=1 Tax=Bradyrhizobium TaxID=374 RepID=UPI0012FDC28C|nr:hypothetical protein [Bradyrhizobium huanghuaihaiense]
MAQLFNGGVVLKKPKSENFTYERHSPHRLQILQRSVLVRLNEDIGNSILFENVIDVQAA